MPPLHSFVRFTLLTCCAFSSNATLSQSLPAPGRTIYKCEQAGKIAYSDQPCLGASKLDIVVPRGMDHLSGKSRTGADVSHEVQRENIANALKPITGMTPAQFEIATRRQRLSTEVQRRCNVLDAAIPLTERRERDASKQDRQQASAELYKLRKEYRSMAC